MIRKWPLTNKDHIINNIIIIITTLVVIRAAVKGFDYAHFIYWFKIYGLDPRNENITSIQIGLKYNSYNDNTIITNFVINVLEENIYKYRHISKVLNKKKNIKSKVCNVWFTLTIGVKRFIAHRLIFDVATFELGNMNRYIRPDKIL